MKSDHSVRFNLYQSCSDQVLLGQPLKNQQNCPQFQKGIQIFGVKKQQTDSANPHAFQQFLEKNGVRGYRAGQNKNKDENSMMFQLVNKGQDYEKNEGFNVRKMFRFEESEKNFGLKTDDNCKASKTSIKQDKLQNLIYRLIAITSCHINLNQRYVLNELIMFVKISKIEKLVNILNKNIVYGLMQEIFYYFKFMMSKQNMDKIVQSNGIGGYHGIRHVISRGSSFGENNFYFDETKVEKELNDGQLEREIMNIKYEKQRKSMGGDKMPNKDSSFQNVFEFNPKKQQKGKKKIGNLQAKLQQNMKQQNIQAHYQSVRNMNKAHENEEQIDIYLKLERQAKLYSQQHEQQEQQASQSQTVQQKNTCNEQFNHKNSHPSQKQQNNLTFQNLLRVQQSPYKSDGRQFFQRFEESERKYHLNPDVLKTSEPDINDHLNGFINSLMNKEFMNGSPTQIEINKLNAFPLQSHENFENGKIVYIVEQNSNKIIPNPMAENYYGDHHQAERNRRKSDFALYQNRNIISSDPKQQPMLNQYFPENSRMPLISSLNSLEDQNIHHKRPRSMTYSMGNNSTNDPSTKNNETSQNTVKMSGKMIQSFNPDYQTTPPKQRQVNIHQSPQSSQPLPTLQKMKSKLMYPQMNPQIKYQMNNLQPQTNKIRSVSSDCRFFYHNTIVPSSPLAQTNFPPHVTRTINRPHIILNKQTQQNLQFQNARNHYQIPVSMQAPINQYQNFNGTKPELKKMHKSPKGIQVCSPRARGVMIKQKRGQYL